jgi:hypothetical protein
MSKKPPSKPAPEIRGLGSVGPVKKSETPSGGFGPTKSIQPPSPPRKPPKK